MRVCFCSTLVFWLIHLGCHSFLNGAEADDGFKGRKWSTGRDGHYRLVVSSDGESLDPEETVSIAEAQEKKLKEKPTEDIFSDKVTQRIILKRGRKRGERVPEETVSIRNRRRNPSVSAATTGLPQTMSYSLYNHFRPLEQDVPQDHLLPFLDFGRKLSPIGSTPSGINSIESSSTPRGELPHAKEEDESVFHEDMDVTVMRKAVERNTVPRGPLPVKPQPHIAAFLRRNYTSSQEARVNTNVDLILINTTTTNNNKTDKKDVHYDLQPNESGIKIHAVLSPDYGLRLNNTEKKAFNQIETKSKLANETVRITENSTPSTNKTEYQKLNTTRHNVTRLSERQHLVIPLKIVQNSTIQEDKSKKEEEKSSSKKEEEKSETSPKPTARVLSTAVVTSVSVKESASRFPRIKTNHTRPESLSYQRLLTKNQMNENVNVTQLENRTRLDNHTMFSSFQNARRKMYTTLRPKTTTYKPVTFRSAFRRNMTGFGTGVVHIVSTPPTYIEVPKIFTMPIQETPSSEVTQNSSSVELTSADIVDKSAALSSLETTVVSTVPSTTFLSTSAATVSISTVKPSTTSSETTEKPSTTPLITNTTEQTEIPSSSSAGTTKRPPIPSEVPTEPTSQTITEPPLTVDTETTETNPPIETTTASLAEETSIEIDLKPLIVDLSTPAERPRPTTVPVTKKPGLLWVYNQRNHSVLKNTPVGVAYPESPLGLATYVLAGLGLVPLILGIFVLLRQLLLKSRKKVLDESEYSSEYNRTPLPTKLPRVAAHINWDGEKTSSAVQTAFIPVTKWEFSRDKLRLQTVLGQGNFGQVWKAEADDLSGHEGSTRLVAVKTVKEGSSLREKEDLLRELGIMQELGAHPNVVTLLGCCTEKEPYLLIMEYVMYGKLLAFLREHRTRAHYFNFSDLSSALTSRDITVFAYCVARGMEYLVTKGIIHRDLAARNILVDHNKLCKIADFGMSRNVQDTAQIYEQRPNRGALPIRWMAPESLYLSLFTQKSDVWSYGILLWEIITLGSTPYNKMGAREVMRQVREGYRLEKPKHCRTELYKVLSKCWHNDPGKRPTFTELKQDLAALLSDEQTKGAYVDLEALAEDMADQVN